MQLEYLFKVRSHERFNQSCVIIHYSALSNDDSITIMFQDGVTLETQRIHLRNKDTIYKRKRKQKMNRIVHPLYDIQVKFRTDMIGKKKLYDYLRKNNITLNDLLNTFIGTL